MFPSEDEASGVDAELPCAQPSKPKKRSKTSTSSRENSKKTKLQASSSPCKPTMKDLFGDDSDDDNAAAGASGKDMRLPCYFTRRVANGYARQYFPNKKGSFYIELKIYDSNEIEKVVPMNRWRQAIVAVKTLTENNTEAWRHLSSYLKITRAEFKECPPSFTNSFA